MEAEPATNSRFKINARLFSRIPTFNVKEWLGRADSSYIAHGPRLARISP
jgi:hypothetical protein